MKKLVILALCVSLMAPVGLVGCAAYNSVRDAISPVTNFICQPTEKQKQDAALMLAAIDAAQAAGAIFYPPIAVAQASAVLNTIKNGGCFLLAQLDEAFKVVDTANTKLITAKAIAVPLPQYASLRNLLK